MTPLERVLKTINRSRSLDVLLFLGFNVFVDLKALKTFKIKPEKPNFILFKYRQPLRGAPIEVDPSKSADLTMGKMHYTYSGGFLFGYLFEFPLLPFRIHRNFCAVNTVNFSVDDIKDVNPVLSNQHLTVYSCSDISVVMVANMVQYIDIKR